MESIFVYIVLVVCCFVSLTIALMLYRILGFRELLGLNLYTWSDMGAGLSLISILSIFPPLIPVAIFGALYVSLLRRIFNWVRQREHSVAEKDMLLARAARFAKSSAKEDNTKEDNAK